MNIALILSGCGYLDGAEIRESVLTLLALDRHGAKVSMFAPDAAQHHVVNHLSGEATSASRNVLEEAARIARGDIAPLETLQEGDYDALVIPGGFGVAKNLSDFAMSGAAMTVDPTFSAIIQAFYQAKKPIGAICIAPVIVAAALKGEGLTLTIGDDAGCAQIITGFGHQHQHCNTDAAIIDEPHRVASCSAYMRDDAGIADVAAGIDRVIDAVITMV